ncbi:MAG: hypothetical protein K6E50_11895 [Lachnospiraceae bacterium]|nr:hypothetical protein [Lachnospiraceae bacterium]
MGGTLADAQERQRKQQQLEAEKTQQADVLTQSMQRSFALQQQQPVGMGPLLVRDVSRNQELLTHVRKHVYSVAAQETADGLPVQAAPVQEQKHKVGLKDKYHDHKIRKLTGSKVLDHRQWDLKERLAEYYQRKENSADYISEQLPGFRTYTSSSVQHDDKRIVLAFTQGYEKKKISLFQSRKETEKRDADLRMARDYMSGNLAQRKPFLEKVTKEMLGVRLEPEMFTDAYIAAHIEEIMELSNKLNMFENIERDPTNAPFFAALSQQERALLKANLDMATMINAYMASYFSSNGLDVNTKQLLAHSNDFDANLATSREMVQGYKAPLEGAFRTRITEEEKILEQFQGQAFRDMLQNAEYRAFTQHQRTQRSPQKLHSGRKHGLKSMLEAMRGKNKGVDRFGKPVDESVLEKMDSVYETTEGGIVQQKAASLVSLGIRATGTPSELGSRAMRGSIFFGMNESLTGLFQELQDQGLPLRQMGEKINKGIHFSSSPQSYATGCGVEAVSRTLFGIFRQRLDTPEGLEYLQSAYTMYGDRKVFQGSMRQFLMFELRTLLNTELSPVCAHVPFEQMKYATGASTSVMALPAMSELLTQEQRTKMQTENPELYQLLLEFENLMDSLEAKMLRGTDDVSQTVDGVTYSSACSADVASMVKEADPKTLSKDTMLQDLAMRDFVYSQKKRMQAAGGTDPLLGAGTGETDTILRVMKAMMPENYIRDRFAHVGDDVISATQILGEDLQVGGALEQLGDYLMKAREVFDLKFGGGDDNLASANMVDYLVKNLIAPMLTQAGLQQLADQLSKEIHTESQDESFRDDNALMRSLNAFEREEKKEERRRREEAQRPAKEIAALDAQFADRLAQISQDAAFFKAKDVKGRDREFVDRDDYINWNRMQLATPEMIAENPMLRELTLQNYRRCMPQRIARSQKTAFRESTPEQLTFNMVLHSMIEPDYMNRVLKSSGLEACLEQQKDATQTAQAKQAALDRIRQDLQDGELREVRSLLESLGDIFKGTALEKEDGSTQSTMMISNLILLGMTVKSPDSATNPTVVSYFNIVTMKAYQALMMEFSMRQAKMEKGQLAADPLLDTLKDKYASRPAAPADGNGE